MTDAINPQEISVAIGFPCRQQIAWQTALSLAATVRAAEAYGIPLQIHVVAGNSSVTDARNAVLTDFLRGDSSRLFWVDDDIEWKPSDFLRVLLLSRHYDVVSAAYPLKRPDQNVVINGLTKPLKTNAHGLIKIESLGIGFTVVTRDALERWVATKNWKRHGTHGTDVVQAFKITEDAGEDINFFRELGALGFDVWLDPSVNLGHIGTFTYRRDIADALGITFTKE